MLTNFIFRQWYCNDPIDVQNLPGFISALLAEEPSDSEHVEYVEPNMSLGLTSSKATLCPNLECLPREILDLVVSFLPTSSTLRLRRCSKTLISRIVLDQQFWRRQLLDGCVDPYLWELKDVGRDSETPVIPVEKTLGHHDWGNLARKLACSNQIMRGDESIPSPPWGLRNRCRIWSLATHLVTTSEG